MIAALARLGIEAKTLAVPAWRTWRWVMPIDGGRVCFFVSSDAGKARLARETRLLQALAGRVAFAIPSVVAAGAGEGLQVRSMVLGDQIVNREPEIGRASGWERIADSYGSALASLHAAIEPAQASPLVDPAPDTLPYPAVRIAPLVERHIDDPGLARAVGEIIAAYAAISVRPSDRVFIHGDLIADNMVFDLAAKRFVGLFDFADANVADRHRDLNYIHSFGSAFADRMMQAYESASSVALDRRRPAIYHIASAISHLIDEDDPSQPSQKRRVERWVRAAIEDAF